MRQPPKPQPFRVRHPRNHAIGITTHLANLPPLLATPNKAARALVWWRVHLGHARQMSPWARLRAWGLGARGRCDAAAEIWRQLARQATQPTAAAVGWTQHGRYRLHFGRLVEATKALERALALAPDYLPALQLRAACAAEQQDWPQAARRWRAVLAASPPAAERAQALQALGRALIEQGAFEDAMVAISQLAELAPARALVMQAQAAEKRFDEKAARAAWESLHERHPDTAAATPGWLKFVGSADAQDAARFTAEDLAKAQGAQTAQQILWYLE